MPTQYEPIYYSINGSLSKIQTTELKSLLDQVKLEIDKIKKLITGDKKIVSFFIELLTPTKSSDEMTKKAKKIDILNILDLPRCIIFRPPVKYDDSTLHYIEFNNTDSEKLLASDLSKINDDTKDNINIVDESIYNTYYILITQYLNNLQNLNDFLIQYPTIEAVQSNKEIWKLYSMLKK
jgi:hypothetical protein